MEVLGLTRGHRQSTTYQEDRNSNELAGLFKSINMLFKKKLDEIFCQEIVSSRHGYLCKILSKSPGSISSNFILKLFNNKNRNKFDLLINNNDNKGYKKRNKKRLSYDLPIQEERVCDRSTYGVCCIQRG